MRHAWVLAACTLTLVGCGTAPKTAHEFRDLVKAGSAFATTETYDVNRPVSAVAASWKENGNRCLRKTVVVRSITNGVSSQSEYTYKPTVVAGKKAELHIQQSIKATNLVRTMEEPPGGYYHLVAEATPLSANRSRIDIYRARGTQSVLLQAIRNWADGSNAGCPDLTRD
jgi:hypothetical protein